jgi:hypothetical protein
VSYFNDKGVAYSIDVFYWVPGSPGSLEQQAFSTLAERDGTPQYLERLKQITFDAPFFGDYGTRGPRRPWNGFAMLDNSDGDLDAYANRNVQKRECVLRVRDSNPDVNTTRTEALQFADAVEVDMDQVMVYLRDHAYMLDKPALTNRYAGNNSLPAGLEGTAADLKGKTKPKLIGKVYNWTPYQVNTSRLIYQVNDGAFNTGWSIVVRDQGVVLTAGANYVSQADMETTAPAAGQYRVWPGGGYIRFGSKPVMPTLDLVNPVSTSLSATPTLSTGHEVHGLVCQLLDWSTIGNTVTAVGPGLAAYPDCGIALEGDVTYLEAINTLFSGVSATWAGNGNVINFYALADPSGVSSPPEYDDDNILETRPGATSLRKVKSGDDDRGVPVWRVVVRYRKNHTVQTGSQLAGGVSAADQAIFGQDYRTVSASDSAVLVDYPNAAEITVDSQIYDEGAAQAEANRLLALLKVLRSFYAFDTTIQIDSANDLTFASYLRLVMDRFELDAGKNFYVIGRKFDSANDTLTVTVWG